MFDSLKVWPIIHTAVLLAALTLGIACNAGGEPTPNGGQRDLDPAYSRSHSGRARGHRGSIRSHGYAHIPTTGNGITAHSGA